MNPIYNSQDNLTPHQWDNETLVQAIDRHNAEKAKREESLLANQGKMEGGLDEIQDDLKS